jgi:hypothetical protein
MALGFGGRKKVPKCQKKMAFPSHIVNCCLLRTTVMVGNGDTHLAVIVFITVIGNYSFFFKKILL